MRFFTATDPLEVRVMIETAQRALALQAELRQDQAVRIANAVAQAVLGG